MNRPSIQVASQFTWPASSSHYSRDLDVLPNARYTQSHGKWAEKDRNFAVTLTIEPVFMRVTREGVKITRSFTAMVASAFFTGMGTTVLSCMAGDGLKTAISKGAIAGACMYMSINTYMAIRIPITKEMPSLATTVFGAGSNIMAATGIAVYSSKRTNGKKYQKTNNNQKKYKKTSAKKYLSNNKSKSWKYFVFKMNQLRY